MIIVSIYIVYTIIVKNSVTMTTTIVAIVASTIVTTAVVFTVTIMIAFFLVGRNFSDDTSKNNIE